MGSDLPLYCLWFSDKRLPPLSPLLLESPEEQQQLLRVPEKGTAYSRCMRFEFLSPLTPGKSYKRWVFLLQPGQSELL